MSRTLSELSAGTKVMVDIKISGSKRAIPFIVLGKSEQQNSMLLLPDLLLKKKRMNSTDSAEYNGCEADSYLSDGFIEEFIDDDLSACLVATNIKTYSKSTEETSTIQRKIFLLSMSETGLSTTPDEGTSYISVLKTYYNTTSAYDARKCTTIDGTYDYYWLRTPYSASSFYCVGNGGNSGSSSATGSGCWLRPCFSVSLDTIVSDGGEDTIYLFPDATKLYREIEGVVYMSQCENRPKKIKVISNIANATEKVIQVSNNAKDETPLWATVPSDGVMSLTNETKTTDKWELGLKFYVKSPGSSVIKEPILIVETESE